VNALIFSKPAANRLPAGERSAGFSGLTSAVSQNIGAPARCPEPCASAAARSTMAYARVAAIGGDQFGHPVHDGYFLCPGRQWPGVFLNIPSSGIRFAIVGPSELSGVQCPQYLQ
jgi:hypothetical protein